MAEKILKSIIFPGLEDTYIVPEQIQVDWNQNDSTAQDYIKNRPFYAGEPVDIEVCDVNAIATASGTAWSVVVDGVMGLNGNSGVLLFDGTIEIGKEYTISVNGTKYEYIAEDGVKYGGEDGLVMLGDTDALINEDIANLKALASFMRGEKIDSEYTGKTFIFMVMVQGNVAPTEFRILDKQQEIVKLDPVYLPDETDPTVPDWAKAETKPAYTATEVGAMPEIETGTVGHFVRVKTVDESGKPTEYESAEIDIAIDTELSVDSENPVQNKVINEAISNLNIVINNTTTLANNTAELVGDTAVSEQINKAIAEIPEQVQSDWSINDEDDKAYVKNRPFYSVLSEPIYNDTVTTKNFKEEYGYDLNLGSLSGFSLAIGDWYVVEFNGATYKCKCIPNPQFANTDYANDYYYIGNGYRAIINNAEANHTTDMGAVIDILNRAGIEDTGEPFCISLGASVLTGQYELATDEVGTYTIKIYREEITTIEEKYIPEDILCKTNDFYCSPKVIYKWNEETTYDDFVELPDGAYANLMEKISDDTPSTDFFIGKIFYTRAKLSGKKIQEIERVITSDNIQILDNMYVVYNYIYIVLADNSDLGFALTKGIWCMGDYDDSQINVYELTISENYRNMIDEVVIPDTIARVADIPEAQTQVQSDWTQTDETAVDFIKNKPDIASLETEVEQKSQVQIVTSDNTEILPTLKIHRLTQDEYEQAVTNGTIDENTLYLTPDEEIDLSGYATEEYVDNAIATIPTPDVSGQIENHNTSADAHEDIRTLIEGLSALVGDTKVSSQISEAIEKIVYPVSSVNGKTGDIILTASDVGALSTDTVIPSIEGLVSEEYVNNAIAQKSQVQIITWEADD